MKPGPESINVRPSDGLPNRGAAAPVFCTKLYQFIREGAVGIEPTHLAIIFDKTRTTFRKEIYADYKGEPHRSAAGARAAVPLMREAVKAFGLIPIEEPGFEADDLIATYSCRASEAGAQTLIVSADKDLMQLVHDGVTFYDFESGIPGKPATGRSGGSTAPPSSRSSACRRSRCRTCRRSSAIRPTTCRACPASGRRPPRR
jgi:DNA polymerase-1